MGLREKEKKVVGFVLTVGNSEPEAMEDCQAASEFLVCQPQ